jgi:DNA-3-methyladenine glycosylase
VAPSLLGARLVSDIGGDRVAVLITEVEAYSGMGMDEASHAHRGPTPRNAVMFGPAGFLYVYRSYGIHWCLNVVTGPPGQASAVLLRAGEVVEGLDIARARRPKAVRDRDLARGPGRLASALGITGPQNGVDLLERGSPVRLLPRHGDVTPIHAVGPRIGITKAIELPWRFWWDGHPTVSR